MLQRTYYQYYTNVTYRTCHSVSPGTGRSPGIRRYSPNARTDASGVSFPSGIKSSPTTVNRDERCEPQHRPSSPDGNCSRKG